jgi:hypothetical protein
MNCGFELTVPRGAKNSADIIEFKTVGAARERNRTFSPFGDITTPVRDVAFMPRGVAALP